MLFGVKKDFVAELQKHFGSNLKYTPVATATEMIHSVAAHGRSMQRIGIVGGGHSFAVIEISNPKFNLPAGTIQAFLDPFLKAGGAERIDYVHGDDVLLANRQQARSCRDLPAGHGEIRSIQGRHPSMALFPVKTFSMGEARAKRFYMEVRKIS